MIANIIYFIVFVILIFVLSIAVKAITRGVEAKQNIKEEKNLDQNRDNEINTASENQNLEIINQLKELKDLHDKGILNDEEFKRAKDKILK